MTTGKAAGFLPRALLAVTGRCESAASEAQGGPARTRGLVNAGFAGIAMRHSERAQPAGFKEARHEDSRS
jgi:hypothetical protein